MTIIAPGNANPARREWGAIIANSFTNVGINAREVFLPWGTVYARVLLPDLSVRGKTFDQGGFDLQLVGYTPSLTTIGGEFANFDSSQFAPGSGNYYLWANKSADTAIRSAIGAGYTPTGIAALKSWEKIQYNDRPEIPIENDIAGYPTAHGLNYHGWDAFYANIAPVPQFLSYGAKTSMTVETTGDFEQMLPPLTTSYYDLEVYNAVYDSMFFVAYASGFPNSTAAALPRVIPDLASSVDISGSTYTYHLNTANFQDGTPFTANDVLFSFLTYGNFNTGSASAALVTSYLGNQVAFTWENGTKTEMDTNNTAGTSWYGKVGAVPANLKPDLPVRSASVVATNAHTVTITLGNFQGLTVPAATFHPELDTIAMLPMDYLQTIDTGCFSPGPTTCGFGSSTFNLATGATYTSNGHTFSGPFGTGPYSFTAYDPVSATASLKAWSGYFNATGLKSEGEFTIQNYYLKYVATATGAIADLSNGVADAIDPQFHLDVNIASGQTSFARVYWEPLAGLQELGVNMQHPIIGTGTGTPKGTAAAARDIRLAFDYLIPRDQIIANLLVGKAAPGDVPFVYIPAYKDPTLTSRPYDPNMALSLLAAAGYNVQGIHPITITPPAVPSFILGSAVPFTGTFSNPATGTPYSGFAVVLQSSTDNKTWYDVSTTTTDNSGAYSTFFVPSATGTYWVRTYFTGVTAATAGTEFSSHVCGHCQINYTGLTTVAAPSYSAATKTTVQTLADVLSQYASNSGLTSANAQLTSLSNQLATANTNISNLQGQVSTLTTVAYGAIAVAIIVGIAGFVFARRKP